MVQVGVLYGKLVRTQIGGSEGAQGGNGNESEQRLTHCDSLFVVHGHDDQGLSKAWLGGQNEYVNFISSGEGSLDENGETHL